MRTTLQAIATMEGFYIVGSRPQRNNSPGDLTWGDEAERFGAVRGDGRYAVFPVPETGWKALQRWLSVPAKFTTTDPGDGRPKGPSGYLVGGYLGATYEQAIWRFAPPADHNHTAGYVEFVCTETGHQPSDILTAETLQSPEVS